MYGMKTPWSLLHDEYAFAKIERPDVADETGVQVDLPTDVECAGSTLEHARDRSLAQSGPETHARNRIWRRSFQSSYLFAYPPLDYKKRGNYEGMPKRGQDNFMMMRK